ncbi:MAG: menaquinone biosynthesis decarboxylase [Herbinix sp.]|jgi:4-hydroxy-3-polyprenylbenzoate decarboxylase|nr:menaquinone biosynthesis decarboxylase [Herbinix sp.]
MSYQDLHTFINELDKIGELKRINAEVSSELEITEITDRISKAEGPALLFENVTGSNYPVLMNAMGSFERMSLGLGVSNLDELGDEISNYLEFGNYLSVRKLIKSIPRFFRLLHVFPNKSRRRGRCQEVIERDVDLGTLPVLKCWPEDAGRFVTLPLVFTKDIKTKQQNVGMYRLQILDKTSTGMHWHKHKDGSEIYKGYKESNQKMPVSVALGCDPSITYASTAPLPKMLDEMMLAGWLRKKRVRLVKCITNDIYVPENAEIVLEGYVDPQEELVLEGPFGDHTGYYSLADYYPRFHVTCITHKKNAIYPATVVGKPPMEDCYMAKATERIFLPMLKMIIPELVDLNLPLEGVFHNCAIVSINSKFPGCAQKTMYSIWGMGQMMYTKLIVVVDASVDVQNLSAVLEAVLNNVYGAEDLVFSDGPLDALDHSSNQALFGCRLGVDATDKLGSHRHFTDIGDYNTAPAKCEANHHVNANANNNSINYTNDNIKDKDNDNARDLTKSIVNENPKVSISYHILTVHKDKPWYGKDTLKAYMKHNADKYVIVVDDDVDPKDLSTVMWKVFNNIDARRDLVIEGARIGIDATKKRREEGLTRDWPNDITMTQRMKQQVDERWSEYGFE